MSTSRFACVVTDWLEKASVSENSKDSFRSEMASSNALHREVFDSPTARIRRCCSNQSSPVPSFRRARKPSSASLMSQKRKSFSGGRKPLPPTPLRVCSEFSESESFDITVSYGSWSSSVASSPCSRFPSDESVCTEIADLTGHTAEDGLRKTQRAARAWEAAVAVAVVGAVICSAELEAALDAVRGEEEVKREELVVCERADLESLVQYDEQCRRRVITVQHGAALSTSLQYAEALSRETVAFQQTATRSALVLAAESTLRNAIAAQQVASLTSLVLSAESLSREAVVSQHTAALTTVLKAKPPTAPTSAYVGSDKALGKKVKAKCVYGRTTFDVHVDSISKYSIFDIPWTITEDKEIIAGPQLMEGLKGTVVRSVSQRFDPGTNTILLTIKIKIPMVPEIILKPVLTPMSSRS